MRTNFILGSALLMAGMMAGCSDDPAPATDAGTDTGTIVDTGAATDTGTTTDAGSTTDAGTVTDTGSATDAGAALMEIHGCTEAMYVDRRTTGERSVTFGGVVGSAYSPKCMIISAGQMVSFSGPFGSHPLRTGVAPSQSGTGATPNPIANTDSGSSVSFTFATPGIYPYYCNFHQPSMAGVILVR